MIQAYSTAYYPPIPVLDISLAAPEESNWIGPYQAIVDSGADITIAPLALITQLNPPVVRSARLRSQWHDRRNVLVFTLDVRISASVQPAVMVAGDPASQEVILGRNLLNRLDTRLQGPALRLHIR